MRNKQKCIFFAFFCRNICVCQKFFVPLQPILALMEENIDLKRLELGVHQFDFQLDSEFFSVQEKSEILSGEVECHVVLTLREDDYDLHLAAKGTVQVTCDRCLDPMDVVVDVEEEAETEEQNMGLNLAWAVYEMIVVNLPLVHSHPEGQCNPAMQELLQTHLCRAVEEPENTI